MTSNISFEIVSRTQLVGDPHRPQYHFLPPANWMNDPNGLIQWKGQYHLFYQYNPYSPKHDQMHWGHAVSSDLLHWKDLPVALTPSPGGNDAEGCWSGCAVNNNGVPTLLYTGVYPQVVCMATSSDDLVTWQAFAANPVISGPPAELKAGSGGHFRDPFVWKESDGYWYMLMGTKQEGVGGLILLYRSQNLTEWEYLHPLLKGDINQHEPLWTGAMWECPNFLDFGESRMLLISVQDAEGRLLYTSYFTGSYLAYKFLPVNSGILVHGGYFYAPQVMRDAQGRYLMWGWLKEGRNKQAMMEAGWAGVMSLPILVSLESDGELKLEPVPELAGLRKQHWCYNNLEITSQDTNPILKEVAGNCLEIIAEFESDQINPFEFKFRCSPNVEEQTRLIYQPTKQQFVLERTQSSLNTKVDQFPSMVPVKIAPGEKLKLHIFLDHSVLEMFVNNRTCLASRIYPGRSDSLGLELVSLEGVVKLKSLDIWTIESVWERVVV